MSELAKASLEGEVIGHDLEAQIKAIEIFANNLLSLASGMRKRSQYGMHAEKITGGLSVDCVKDFQENLEVFSVTADYKITFCR